MTTTNSQVLRKLTIASTGWNKSAIMAAIAEAHGTPKDGDKIECMKIVGVTTSATPGQTDKGEYLKFKGEFGAVNMDTGESFSAAVCILPNFIADTLSAALEASERVEFAFMIGAKYSAKSVTGYEFTVTPLIEAKPSDAMARLLELTGDITPKLEAPKPAAKSKK